jgi:hypothetical protein
VIPCFGDTSYYLAALIPQDINHNQARRLATALRRTVVTSEFVLLEVGNYLSASTARGKFGPFLESIRADAYTTVVPASSALLARGFALYRDRPDKN